MNAIVSHIYFILQRQERMCDIDVVGRSFRFALPLTLFISQMHFPRWILTHTQTQSHTNTCTVKHTPSILLFWGFNRQIKNSSDLSSSLLFSVIVVFKIFSSRQLPMCIQIKNGCFPSRKVKLNLEFKYTYYKR